MLGSLFDSDGSGFILVTVWIFLPYLRTGNPLFSALWFNCTHNNLILLAGRPSLALASLTSINVLISFPSRSYWTTLYRVLVLTISLFFILTGLSRIYLGVHYASDVIGAYIIALIYLSGINYFYETSNNSRKIMKNNVK